jgi:phospholipase/carboxylesterase
VSPTPIDLQPLVRIADADRATRLVVLLHGYGDDPSALFDLTGEVHDTRTWVTVAPRGPVRTGAGGPAWFPSGPEDRGPELAPALEALDRLVAAVCTDHGLTIADTAVLGYSQGAAAALALAFRSGAPWRPLRVAAHAAWLPDGPGIDWAFAESRAVDALLTHGTHDEVVPVQQGRSAARVLERSGVHCDFVTIDGGHELSAMPLDHIATWLSDPPIRGATTGPAGDDPGRANGPGDARPPRHGAPRSHGWQPPRP